MFWRKRSSLHNSKCSMISSESTYSYEEKTKKDDSHSSSTKKTRNSLSGGMLVHGDLQEYVVQPGDTLQSVAVKFSTTPSDIGLLNHWFGSTHQRQLLPGSTIKVFSVNPAESLNLSHATGSSNAVGEPLFTPTRPAPGLASRLTPNTEAPRMEPSFSFEVVDIPQDRTSIHDFLTLEDEEKGFVRVSADRILLKELHYEGSSSLTEKRPCSDPQTPTDSVGEIKLEFVSGTIIVTPDFFVFEPQSSRSSAPPSPSDKFSRTPSSSNHSPSTDQPPVIVPHPAAVCQPLASIESMYTRMRLTEVWSPLCHVTNSDTGESISTSLADQISKLLHKEEPSQPTSSGSNVTKTGTSPSVEECASPVFDATPTRIFLCLQPNQDEDEKRRLFSLMVFAIQANEIDEVYASMLNWGVGHSNQAQKNSWVMFESSPEELQKCGLDLSNQNNRLQNDLVANELKRLNEEKYRPILKGGSSDILTDEMLSDISECLPSHLYGNNLSLIYKTSQDGFSLLSIYRKMRNVNSAVLLIIRDTNDTMFGAILSEKMRPSQYFYGKGETFVFHWNPTLKTYKWTGANTFFMKGDNNYFSIGAKSGHNAIWFEDNLKNGRSENTDTFNNPILCGGPSSAFTIDCLEVWQFVG